MGAVRVPAPALLGFLLLAAAGSAPAADVRPAGEWDSPLGRIRISGDGTTFRGTLVAPVARCALAEGAEVLRATLLDDSLAGELRVCLSGPSCAPSAWSSAVLLVGKDRLAGAVHVKEAGCRASAAGKQGGVTFTRVESARGSTGSPRTDSGSRRTDSASRRARARALLRDGAAHLHEGAFERARERFLEAIDADARVPEAYNGVGVTFRMRNDLAEALAWYKKALAIDPDFGDAWYNMACVYALQGKHALALRYLQIAALNGYATAAGIDGDPDLDALRTDPAYRALVQARM
jgi:tetratricopeptide (TPR) repeat protein